MKKLKEDEEGIHLCTFLIPKGVDLKTAAVIAAYLAIFIDLIIIFIGGTNTTLKERPFVHTNFRANISFGFKEKVDLNNKYESDKVNYKAALDIYNSCFSIKINCPPHPRPLPSDGPAYVNYYFWASAASLFGGVFLLFSNGLVFVAALKGSKCYLFIAVLMRLLFLIVFFLCGIYWSMDPYRTQLNKSVIDEKNKEFERELENAKTSEEKQRLIDGYKGPYAEGIFYTLRCCFSILFISTVSILLAGICWPLLGYYRQLACKDKQKCKAKRNSSQSGDGIEKTRVVKNRELKFQIKQNPEGIQIVGSELISNVGSSVKLEQPLKSPSGETIQVEEVEEQKMAKKGKGNIAKIINYFLNKKK